MYGFLDNVITHLIDYIECKHDFDMHWETKNLCDSLYCDTRFIEVVWN